MKPSLIAILLAAGFVLRADAAEERVLRTYTVPIHGIPAHLTVIATEYELTREQLVERQLRKARFEPTPPPAIRLDPAEFQPIPGIPSRTNQAVSNIETATSSRPILREKLALTFDGDLVGEIPGNPQYGAQLSGRDYGFRNPVVEKVIAIGERQLVIIVAEKGWGGTELDRVYEATRNAEGSWKLAQVPLGGTAPPLRGPSFDHEPLPRD